MNSKTYKVNNDITIEIELVHSREVNVSTNGGDFQRIAIGDGYTWDYTWKQLWSYANDILIKVIGRNEPNDLHGPGYVNFAKCHTDVVTGLAHLLEDMLAQIA